MPRILALRVRPRAVVWISAAAVFVAAACEHDGCVSASQAEIWTKRAEQAEAGGHIYEAWQSYKSIGVKPACDFNSDQRAVANKERSRLRAEINGAYDITIGAIDDFRAINGRLPSSLLEIAADIPQTAQRAFREFRYAPQTNELAGRAG